MRLAFLGDSLTYGWTTDGASIWRARYEPLGAENFGVPGDRTDDVLVRIVAGELDELQPDTVVFLAGTNDLGSGRTARQTAAGVKTCLDALRARFPCATVLLLALLPRGDGGEAGYAAIAAANERLASIAGAERRVRFADLTATFSGEGGLRPELYDADRLHLAPAGYAAWADALGPELARFADDAT